MQTPLWALALIAANQANADITHNSALLALDALVGHWIVINTTTTAPPGSPAPGDCYVVGTSATGAWAGQDGNLAVYEAVSSGWIFFPIKYGVTMYDLSADTLYVWKMDNTWHTIV